MNKLMVIYGNNRWFYYKTECKTAIDAYNEMLEMLKSIDIDVCTMYPDKVILKNKDGITIDKETF